MSGTRARGCVGEGARAERESREGEGEHRAGREHARRREGRQQAKQRFVTQTASLLSLLFELRESSV